MAKMHHPFSALPFCNISTYLPHVFFAESVENIIKVKVVGKLERASAGEFEKVFHFKVERAAEN